MRRGRRAGTRWIPSPRRAAARATTVYWACADNGCRRGLCCFSLAIAQSRTVVLQETGLQHRNDSPPIVVKGESRWGDRVPPEQDQRQGQGLRGGARSAWQRRAPLRQRQRRHPSCARPAAAPASCAGSRRMDLARQMGRGTTIAPAGKHLGHRERVSFEFLC